MPVNAYNALKRQADLLLIDDRVARNIAEHLGLNVLANARKKAEELCDLNFGVADAAHIAFAEQCGAEFISCDDSLIKKCSRQNIKIWCGNPVAFCEKEGLR